MQDGKNHALERFLASVDKPEEKTQAPTPAMIGSVTLMRGHVIVMGDVTADALEKVLGRRRKAA